MKSDIDAHLERAQLDGLLVLGSAMHNPNMAYFTGPAHLGYALLAWRRGSQAKLYCLGMERDEAATTGLAYEVIERNTVMKAASGDAIEAEATWVERILRENDLTGRLFVCGQTDSGSVLELFRRLQSRIPGLRPVGLGQSRSPVLLARATKDIGELDRIRRTGRLTTEVVGWVSDFLTSHTVRDGLLVGRDGEALLIGEVRRRINLWLAERGLENPEGTIFAIGRDAGVPHSVGRNDQPVPIGQPIVFDIYPCEAGGGYFYDFTRTWCLDHAPDPVAKAHEDVLEAYRLAVAGSHAGVVCRELQRSICEFFEGRGHATVLNTPETQEGYVHSLGHGLGLAVHEPPYIALLQDPPDVLAVGNVITIEPGLYYPERSLGVRLEDTVAIGSDGAEVLAPYPMDLVLPMRGKARGKTKARTAKQSAKPRAKRRR